MFLLLEKGEGCPFSIDQSFTGGDQMVLVIEQLDIIDGRPLGPAKFSRLGDEPARERRGRNIGDIHI